MFEKAYRGAMRNGSRLLFAIGVILFAAVIIQWLLGFLPLGFENRPQSSGVDFLPMIVNAFSVCVWPLFGALVFDRLDRWLSGSGESEPEVGKRR